MASSIDTVQYICDQAGLGRRLAFRKMFGEYALYLDGKVVALICDDQLFLKPTSEGRSYLGKVSEAPPYPGAKNYFLLASELDDPDRLGMALQVTAGALPEPKPRATRKKRAAPRARNAKQKPSRRKS
jgi:TfoX/Sxy family transcriptional regulator of competence genes